MTDEERFAMSNLTDGEKEYGNYLVGLYLKKMTILFRVVDDLIELVEMSKRSGFAWLSVGGPSGWNALKARIDRIKKKELGA